LRVSPLGNLLLVFCVAMALASVLFMSLSWAAVVVALSSIFAYARMQFISDLRATKLDIERSVLEKIIFAKEPVTVKVDIVNKTATKIYGTIEDILPEGSEVASGLNRFTATLRPRTVESFRYSVKFGKRGPHRLGGLKIERTDSLGLFMEDQTFGRPTTVTAHTKKRGFDTARKIAGREHLEYSGPSRTPAAVIREQEFNGIRDYIPGDRARDIFWKSLSKTNRLMTKTFVKETSLRTMIFLDCTRSMRRVEGGASKMDHAVDLSLQIANVLIGSYHPTGVAIYDETSVLELTPPGLGRRKFEDIFRVLRHVPPSIESKEVPPEEGQTTQRPLRSASMGNSPDSFGFFSAVANIRGRGQDLGIDSAIRRLITHSKGQQQLFIVISDLDSSRNAVLASAKFCEQSRNRMLVIHTHDDWYSHSAEMLDVAQVERMYENLSSNMKVEAGLKGAGASYLRVGPADTSSRIVRNIRRGLA
jgi:uncharacterized protein (DUF58 family)